MYININDPMHIYNQLIEYIINSNNYVQQYSLPVNLIYNVSREGLELHCMKKIIWRWYTGLRERSGMETSECFAF